MTTSSSELYSNKSNHNNSENLHLTKSNKILVFLELEVVSMILIERGVHLSALLKLAQSEKGYTPHKTARGHLCTNELIIKSQYLSSQIKTCCSQVNQNSY